MKLLFRCAVILVSLAVSEGGSSATKPKDTSSSVSSQEEDKGATSSPKETTKAPSISSEGDDAGSSTSSEKDDTGSSTSSNKEYQIDNGIDNVLRISPEWSAFARVDEPEGQILGTLSVEYKWNPGPNGPLRYYPDIGDVRDVVILTNFATGNVGRVKTASLNSGNVHRSSMIHVGAFHQYFDAKCYPWDTQIIVFDFHIPAPFSKVFKFRLFCNYLKEYCTAYDAGVKLPTSHTLYGTRLVQHSTDGEVVKGFTWSVFTCDKISDSSVHCEMTATRSQSKDVVIQFIPGFLMVIVGFGSFMIPVNMAMPRVGTCMIALLTFVGKGSIVMQAMPKGEMSIVEEMYIWGMLAMLLNMMGHILSWRFGRFAPIIDELSMGGFFFFLLMLVARLHARACPLVSATVTGFLVALTSILYGASVLASLWYHRDLLRKVQKSVNQTTHDVQNMTSIAASELSRVVGMSHNGREKFEEHTV